jgi:hypothetical protein
MKLFSFNRNQVAVLVTIMVLVVLGALFFFVYMPNNEKRIQKQRFQALQNIDANIRVKIENSVSLLNNTMTDYLKGNSAHQDTLKEYILGFPRNHFTLSLPKEISYEQSLLGRDSSAVDSAYSLSANNDNQNVRLIYDKNFEKGRRTVVYRMVMEFSYQQFFSPLLRGNVFDEYIVFKDQKPVFETFPAGVSSFQKDTVLGIKDGVAGASIGSYKVGGVDYHFFLQPVRLNSENDWVVSGLLSNDHYQAKKSQLPPQVVLLLVSIVLVLLLSFPWIKLYQMGSKDRLTFKDAVSSLMISMLLMSLVFFLFFHHNGPFRSREKIDTRKIIADSIHHKLLAETRVAVKTLTRLDTLLKYWQPDSISGYDTSMLGRSNNYGVSDSAITTEITKDIHISQMFWIDQSGQELINWRLRKGAYSRYHPYGIYKERNYFKEILGKGGLTIEGDITKFSIEQVISWTRFSFTSVVAKRSVISEKNRTVVACMSFNLRSVEDVLLPVGYEFAVIDNQAKVLYHSDKLRNLNETLTTKFSDSAALESCLAARAPGTFKTTYYDNNYTVQVVPVMGLPYFVVVLEDTGYDDAVVTESYSFTFSMLILFFAFLMALFLGVFLVSARRSFFKKQLYDTGWIGPKISCHKEYMLTSLMNLIVILVLILIFSQPGFLTYFFILVFTVAFLPLFQNSVLARRYFIEKKSTVLFKRNALVGLGVSILIIDIVASRMLEGSNFICLLLYELFLLLVGVGIFITREFFYNIPRTIRQSKFGRLFSLKWNYVNSFSLMALTRLVIMSGIPIVFFYINSHNYEHNLNVRYKQSDFAEKLVRKFKDALPFAQDSLTGNITGVYFDQFAIKHYIQSASLTAPSHTGNREDDLALRLIRQFRLNLEPQAVREHLFYRDVAGDSNFRFNPILRDIGQPDTGSVLYKKISASDSSIIMRSAAIDYSFPDFGIDGHNGLLFWLLLLMALTCFYFVIYMVIKKLFALGLPDIEVWKNLDNNILSNKLLNGTLFVIGLPGSGKKNFIKNKFKKNEITFDDGTAILLDEPNPANNNAFIAELVNIPSTGSEAEGKRLWRKYTKQVFESKHKLIIVNHFEYNIQDPVSNHYKLEFLEHLYLEARCKIIILSTIHPVAFLDSMEHFSKEQNKAVPGQDLERWHVLLGHYRIVVLPLQLGITSDVPAAARGQFISKKIVDARNQQPIENAVVTIKDTDVQTLTNHAGEFFLQKASLPFTICIAATGFTPKELSIDQDENFATIEMEEDDSFIFTELTFKETSNTHFLRNMQQSIFEVSQEIPGSVRIEKFDELAFKLQITAHYFYMYIWQSLTKEEKFLLYDLAEDNLVNSFDDYNLSMLLTKGVIVRRDGTLKFFNKGFRNFILTAIGNTEAVKIKSQISENGNWNKLKGPLQIVIIAILFFLFASQEEAFSKLIGYVAALGAGIPAILKLFSLLEKSPTKPN